MSDALNPRARAFLRSVKGADDPTRADQARVRARVKARLAAGVAAGVATFVTSRAAAATGLAGAAAPTTFAATATGTLAAKIAAAVLVVGAAAGATTAVVRRGPTAPAVSTVPATHVVAPALRPSSNRAPNEARPAPVTLATETPAPVTLPPGPASTAPEAATQPPPVLAAPVMATPAAATPSESRPVRALSPREAPAPAATGTASVAVTESPLDAEIALLREARAALRGGDAGRSLALLDEHDRRFPGGALGEDGAAQRIYALCALGRADRARALVTRFLADHPLSPHAVSVRASCGGQGGTE